MTALKETSLVFSFSLDWDIWAGWKDLVRAHHNCLEDLVTGSLPIPLQSLVPLDFERIMSAGGGSAPTLQSDPSLTSHCLKLVLKRERRKKENEFLLGEMIMAHPKHMHTHSQKTELCFCCSHDLLGGAVSLQMSEPRRHSPSVCMCTCVCVWERHTNTHTHSCPAAGYK